MEAPANWSNPSEMSTDHRIGAQLGFGWSFFTGFLAAAATAAVAACIWRRCVVRHRPSSSLTSRRRSGLTSTGGAMYKPEGAVPPPTPSPNDIYFLLGSNCPCSFGTGPSCHPHAPTSPSSHFTHRLRLLCLYSPATLGHACASIHELGNHPPCRRTASTLTPIGSSSP